MSGEADPLAYIEDWNRRLSQTGWWHSFELPDGTVIAGVNSLEAQKTRIARFPIPADLTGRRVLDIGAWDGWFTFEMERRGAHVVAIDRWDNPRFREMHAALGSRSEYRQMNVYDLTPAKLGQFDIVLFLGVFYHLKHPLLALERVCAMSRHLVAFESFALTERFRPGIQVEQYPLLQFFERDDFGGQFDNWFAATPRCLVSMCRVAGFARAELLAVHDYGAAVACYRNWPETGTGLSEAPQLQVKLRAAVHAENFGINFSSIEDEYVQCQVETPALLTTENVEPEIGGFGAAPASVVRSERGIWLCTLKLPPGLGPGWHSVRVRLRDSAWSNETCRIAVDAPLQAERLAIESACDGLDWTPGRFSLAHGHLSVWARGLPENADLANVRVELGGKRLSVAFVGPEDAAGLRQINGKADGRFQPGPHSLRVECGGARSDEFAMEAAPV